MVIVGNCVRDYGQAVYRKRNNKRLFDIPCTCRPINTFPWGGEIPSKILLATPELDKQSKMRRFLQPDTIVPLASQGVMAHDRYAGMNNNPVRYVDPSGHAVPSEDPYKRRGVVPDKSQRSPAPIEDHRETGSACSGAQISVLCKDQTLVSSGQATTSYEYPIYKTPATYDGPYAEKTGNLLIDSILLAADGVHYTHYQTDLPARNKNFSVSATVNYEIHKNAEGYYNVITSLEIHNSTDADMTLDYAYINDDPGDRLYPNSMITIAPNTSLRVPTSIYSPGSSGAFSFVLASDIYNPITLKASYP